MIAALRALFAPPIQWGSDEIVYNRQAQTIVDYGLGGFRLLASRYLDNPKLAAYPSPLRWLWVLAQALTARAGRRFFPLSCLVAVPVAAFFLLNGGRYAFPQTVLVATSPLLWILSRRALQDAPVALVVTAALSFAIHGQSVAFAIALFALLSLKEAAALYLPALLGAAVLAATPAEPIEFLIQWGGAVVAALAAWLVCLRLVVGPNTWRVFRASFGGHRTQYTDEQQSGGTRRLLADFAILSPLPLLTMSRMDAVTLPLFTFAALSVAAHAASPVHNVRTLLGADIALRAGVATIAATVDWRVLSVFIAVDLVAIWRLRNTYDPVTVQLIKAFSSKP